jgi:hypothetical protein
MNLLYFTGDEAQHDEFRLLASLFSLAHLAKDRSVRSIAPELDAIVTVSQEQANIIIENLYVSLSHWCSKKINFRRWRLRCLLSLNRFLCSLLAMPAFGLKHGQFAKVSLIYVLFMTIGAFAVTIMLHDPLRASFRTALAHCVVEQEALLSI